MAQKLRFADDPTEDEEKKKKPVLRFAEETPVVPEEKPKTFRFAKELRFEDEKPGILETVGKVLTAPSRGIRKLLSKDDPVGEVVDTLNVAQSDVANTLNLGPRDVLAGSLKAGGQFMGDLDALGQKIGTVLGVPQEGRKGFFKGISQSWGYWGSKLQDQGLPEGMAKKLLTDAGAMAFDLPAITALGGMAPYSLIRGAATDENTLRGAVVGAFEGVMLHHIFKGLNVIPRFYRVPAGGLVMAGLTPGSFDDKLRAFVLGAGMSMPGGKGSWEDFKSAYDTVPAGREYIAKKMVDSMRLPLEKFTGVRIDSNYVRNAGGYEAVVDRMSRLMTNYRENVKLGKGKPTPDAIDAARAAGIDIDASMAPKKKKESTPSIRPDVLNSKKDAKNSGLRGSEPSGGSSGRKTERTKSKEDYAAEAEEYNRIHGENNEIKPLERFLQEEAVKDKPKATPEDPDSLKWEAAKVAEYNRLVENVKKTNPLEDIERQEREARSAEIEKNMTAEQRTQAENDIKNVEEMVVILNGDTRLLDAFLDDPGEGGLENLRHWVEGAKAGQWTMGEAAAEIKGVAEKNAAVYLDSQLDLNKGVMQRANEEFQRALPGIIAKNQARQEAGYFMMNDPYGRRAGQPKSPEQIAAEEAFRTRLHPYGFTDKAKNMVRDIQEDFKRTFIFEHTLKNHLEFKNELRKFNQAIEDAVIYGNKQVVSTIGELEVAEYQMFSNIVGISDILARAKNGQPAPNRPKGYSDEGWIRILEVALKGDPQTGKKGFLDMATPPVLKALETHGRLSREVGESLVQMGKMKQEALRDDYYHHRVLEYTPEWDNVFFPKRLRDPHRHYTIKSRGSTSGSPIDFSYKDAMLDYYSSYFMDNSVDKFWRGSVEKYDLFGKMKPDQRAKLIAKEGKFYPEKIMEIAGKVYKIFQYDPGVNTRPVMSLEMKEYERAAKEAWLGEDYKRKMKENQALSGQKKMSLLPIEIADRLEQFRKPAGDIPLFWKARNLVGTWKRVTLDIAGIPFQMNNFIGDAVNLYRVDPKAFTKVRDAFSLVYNDLVHPERLTAKQKEISALAHEQRVAISGLMKETGLAVVTENVLKKFDQQQPFNPLNYAGHAATKFAQGYERISNLRESTLRMAKFMKDLERIANKKSVVASSIDVEGLTPINAAGKLAREFTVDYGAVTKPYARFLRGMLAPFMTFYDYNMRAWTRYVAKKPGDFFMKFILPSIPFMVWNNTGDRLDTEKDLGFWRWMPHVVTGYKTKEGKPIIVGFQTPFDMALQFTGLNRFPGNVTDVISGKKTIVQALAQQAKDTFTAPAEATFRLIGPWFTVPFEIFANKEFSTGRSIVGKDEKGTKYEPEAIGRYVMKRLFAPYMQFNSIKSNIENSPDFKDMGQIFVKGPLGILSAFGYKTVDIDMNALGEAYQFRENETNEQRNKLAQMERAYLEAVDKKGGEWADFLREKGTEIMNKPGGIPTGAQVINRLSSVKVTMKVLRILAKHAATPEARTQIIEAIEACKTIEGYDDFVKHTPKGIQVEVLDKYIKYLQQLATRRDK